MFWCNVDKTICPFNCWFKIVYHPFSINYKLLYALKFSLGGLVRLISKYINNAYMYIYVLINPYAFRKELYMSHLSVCLFYSTICICCCSCLSKDHGLHIKETTNYVGQFRLFRVFTFFPFISYRTKTRNESISYVRRIQYENQSREM